MSMKRKAPTGKMRKAALAKKAKSVAKSKKRVLSREKPKALHAEKATSPTQPRGRAAPVTMFNILYPGTGTEQIDPNFPDAPHGWTQDQAEARAAEAGLKLAEDHWEVIRVLQGCYKDEVSPRIRLLRDALEARFTAKGGTKYLYEILPGGPIAQGCTLAGVKPPPGAKDLSFGSVA